MEVLSSMTYDNDFIEDVLDEIEDQECDKLVLSIVGYRNRPILKTRIQKEALIFNQVYSSDKSHEAYYFGGYSDDIDESYSSLVEIGLMKNVPSGFVLTEFGGIILNNIEQDEDKGFIDKVRNIEKSIQFIDDKALVAITYHLFPDLAKKSTIADSISPLIEKLLLNGKALKNWNADEFKSSIRNGDIMHVERI